MTQDVRGQAFRRRDAKGKWGLRDAASQDALNAPSCSKADDLYSRRARATMARLLCDHLAQCKLTVTELIHRSDALQKFEAAGTLFQFAIQKVAVAQASSTPVPVQQLVRHLNALATEAIQRVYRDQRRGVFPKLDAGQFGPEAEKLVAADNGLYLLNGAISAYLRTAVTWNEKILRLLALADEANGDTPGGAFLLSAVDGIVAESLGGSAALHELIGEQDNLGSALTYLVLALRGEAAGFTEGQTGLSALAHRFSIGLLPEARTAIGGRLVGELKSTRRLCPSSLAGELSAMKRIADGLMLSEGKYLSHDDIADALAVRSLRLVNHETLQDDLRDAAGADNRLGRLLFVEENLFGAESKRKLGSKILLILASSEFKAFFCSCHDPVLSSLQRLASLQATIQKSGFQDNQREAMANALDGIAVEVEARARLLDGIQSRPGCCAEKAVAFLRLCASGLLTEGRLSARARQLALSHMGQPGFLTFYAARSAQSTGSKPDPQAAIAELMPILRKAGISPEAGMKAIAA